MKQGYTRAPLSIIVGFSTITAGLQADVAKFFLFYLTLVLSAVGGAAIAFTFSAMVSVFSVANLLTSLIFVFCMVRIIGFCKVFVMSAKGIILL